MSPESSNLESSSSEPSPEISRRLQELREEIRHHDHLYYVEDAPKLQDVDYDRLYQELVRLEEQFPQLVTPDSPTQRVGGAPLDSFSSVAHTAPMLSLESSQSTDALRRFCERVGKGLAAQAASGKAPTTGWVVDPKLDGLSVELVYENGLLSRAATRGDGTRGEGITENVKTIPSVPLRLRETARPAPSLLALRGEIVLQVQGFAKLNESLIAQGKDPFANPRNAAAGSVRQLDPTVTASRPLEVYVYDVLAVEPSQGEAMPPGVESQWQVLEALRDWGFRVNRLAQQAADADGILAYHRTIEEQRDFLEYEIDGIVIKLDDLAARQALGTTRRHPRWAFAFKFPPRKEKTRILGILASVGRTGVVTPVAELQPVEIGGVTVGRATLHNREEVARKDVREGDLVRVQRAGDVIPQVIERIEEPDLVRAEPFSMPETCPSCGTPLIERGPFSVCPNHLECRAQLAGGLTHFGSRNALDIEGLGEKTAKLLVREGLVRHLPELFDLEAAQLLPLEGFAEKSANALIEDIERASHTELHRFLFGLGIPEVGVAVARDLAQHFGTLEALRQADEAALTAVPGIGPRMTEQILTFFGLETHQELLDELLDGRIHLAPPPEPASAGEHPLAGLKMVFTGGMDALSRPQAKKIVEGAGAKVVSSVSKATDYVVAGADPGSKYRKAVDLGIEILDEAAFLALLEKHSLAP